MRRALRIAQREYIETIRTKVFIFSVVFAPAIAAAAIFFAAEMSQTKDKPRENVSVTVTDRSGGLSQQIADGFGKYNKKNPKRKVSLMMEGVEADEAAVDKAMKDKLRDGKLDIYVVVDPNVTGGSGQVHIYTYKMKAVNSDALWTAQDIVSKVIVDERCKARGMSRKELSAIYDVSVDQVDVGKTEAEEKKGGGHNELNQMVPFFFVYMMFMGVLAIGPHMVSSLIEEKNSRIMEVLLSAVSPHEIMLGKIAGLGAVGLTVITFWMGLAYAGTTYAKLPIYVAPGLTTWFALYYVLGFLFFGALMAGAGSVCNTAKEAQSLLLPVTYTMIVPLIAWPSLVQSPNGMLARVLSFIAPMTPLVMVARLASGSQIWWVEQVLVALVLLASVIGAIWAAGKVFRVGVLMYGKRPSLAEIGRMVMQK
jgi:ABC-2 type transport system permease protein